MLKGDDIREALKEAARDYSLEGVSPRKVLLLILVCAVTAVVFFPAHTYFSFTYKIGDVAVMDIKSPVDIETDEVSIKKGEIVVREGERVTEDATKRFTLITEVLKEKRMFLPIIGLFIFVAVLIASNYLFGARNVRKFATLQRDLVFMAVIFLGVLLILRFSGSLALLMQTVFPLIPSTVYIYMIPVAAGAMLVRLFLNSETAFVFAAVVAIMGGFFLGKSIEIVAYFFIGGVVASMGIRHATQRSTVMKAGLHLGVVNCVVLLSMAAIRGGATLSEPFLIVIGGLLNGVLTAVVTVGVAPLLEMGFGYTTNIKLLELSRMDHPLLKELAVRAPGTYHHSVVIGTLVESAAESINANPLMARVSAYYHDIGKLKMPLYFIENMSGENRHDKLTPSMSALIITSHTKEGVELAKKYGLGKEMIDVIQQHHGTNTIKYFFQKAKDQEEPGAPPVDEKNFTYAGPRPQTKEAGLVMLADAIEAASRTLPDPTPAKIQGMTQKIVNRIFTDGQLDECELTLKDLHSITSSFNHVLAGIFHQRIEYPEPAYIKKEEVVEGAASGQGEVGVNEVKAKKGGRDGIKRLGVK